jgi:hypothetical protein
MIKIILFLFCLTTFFFFLKYGEKTKKNFFLLIILFLVLLAAFRDGNAVRDYKEYVNLYETDSISKREVAFRTISWFVRYIFSDNVLFLFIIYAALGVCIKTYAINELTTLFFFSILIYIGNLYILHELTQIRVGVSAGLMLLSIKPLYERNNKEFVILTIIAVMFHYVAFLAFFLLLLRRNKINRYVCATIIPLAYIVYFLNINIVEIFIRFIPIGYIQDKYNTYISLQEQNIDSFNKINVFNKVFLAKTLIYYFILWKYNVIIKYNKYAALLLEIEAVSLLSFILLSAMPVFAFRIYEFFGVVEIILIPFLYYTFKSKLFSSALVIFIGLCLLVINIYYNQLIV